MIDLKACEWLMANADAPIRYRVIRELLGDINTAKKIEIELLENPVVKLWLKNLKPQSPPQLRSIRYFGIICRSVKTRGRKTDERLNQHSKFNCYCRIYAISIIVNT